MSPKAIQNTDDTLLLDDSMAMEADYSDDVTTTTDWKPPPVWSPPHCHHHQLQQPFIHSTAAERENRPPGTVIGHPFISRRIPSEVTPIEGSTATICIFTPPGTDPNALLKDPKALILVRILQPDQTLETIEEKEKAGELIDDDYSSPSWDEAFCGSESDKCGSSSNGKKRYPRNLIPPEETDPVITESMLAINDEFLRRPNDEQTLQYEGFKIVGGEMKVLRNNEWLSDSIIDYYFKLLSERSRNNPTLHPKIYCFGCYFYKMLAESGISTVEDAADDVDLFSYEYIFFPAVAQSHWRLIVANVAERTITSYNSARGFRDEKILNNIEKYLIKDEQRRSKKANEEIKNGDGESNGNDENSSNENEELKDNEPIKWSKIPKPPSVPQQENGYDCGVFILEFADYICRKKEFDFKQRNMTYFRERILHECINKTLLG